MDFREFFYPLMICFFLSFLIGIERQYNKRIIGLRTTILVSLGAFLFVSFSFSVGATDISRIASTVVTGIGFLGAGVILKDGKKVRGLTTAATLWCDAAIGILCAGGAIFEAILGTVILLFANTILRHINKFINSLSDSKHMVCSYNLIIKGSKTDIKKIKKSLNEYSALNKLEITSLTIKPQIEDDILNCHFELLKENTFKLQNLTDEIYKNYQLKKLELVKEGEIKSEDYDEEV